jgi:hypothetical protein
MPTLTVISTDFDARDFSFSRPGYPLNGSFASLEHRAFSWTDNNRLNLDTRKPLTADIARGRLCQFQISLVVGGKFDTG